MRKFIVILVLIACAGTGAILFALKNADVHHYPERRAWKDRAIREINNDLEDAEIYRVLAGELPRSQGERLSTDGNWLTRRAIAFRDDSWMVYRQQCHKADPKIYDIFIGRGSDGKWYYSDAHFCINAYVLNSRGQPKSIGEFKQSFHLVEFDGRSDAALESTITK